MTFKPAALPLLVACARLLAEDKSAYPTLFERAAGEFGVPPDVLKGIAFAETRWSHLTWAEGDTAACNGMPRPFGILSLWDNNHFGHSLSVAAGLIGREPEDLKRDAFQNMRGAAALLRKIYGETPLPDGTTQDDIESWRNTIAAYCGIPQTPLAQQHALEVFAHMNRGYHRHGIEWPARLVRLGAMREAVARIQPAQSKIGSAADGPLNAIPDYPGALWRPAYPGHWYTTGAGRYFVVIHDMEGYYLSTISYFQQSNTLASIHYCVNGLSDYAGDAPPGEITQMVEERYWAWHVRCWNLYMLGIEHEGFVVNPAWYTEEQYRASARLTRYLCDKYSIPADRNHIIAHGEWQNAEWRAWMSTNWPDIDTACNNHTDPGPNWDWNYYLQLIRGVPAAPGGLTATPVLATRINLAWTDTSTNELGFKIERAASDLGPWTQVAVLASNVMAYADMNLTGSTTYYYRARAYNGSGDSDYTTAASATTSNSAPVFGAMTSRAINEGEPLQFVVAASDPAAGVSYKTIARFEEYAPGTPNGSVMFRQPGYSGTTSAFLDGATNWTSVTDIFPPGNASSRVLRVTWSFAAGAVNPWLRLTTASPANLPNPTLALNQILEFDIYSDKALKVGLGVRETNTGAELGEDGGTGGPIEFVGATNRAGTTPDPIRVIAAGVWTRLQFDLPAEPTTNFTGNGILESAGGRGVLEHLALVPAGGSGPYTVYLDNFVMVHSNRLQFSLPGGAPTGAGVDPATGTFTWTPLETQGPSTNFIAVCVTDNGYPSLSTTQTLTVIVNEVNSRPVMPAIGAKTVNEGSLLTFTQTATDPDYPANELTFTLDADAPAGAAIDAGTGVFTWVPAETQGPGDYTITLRVTDHPANAGPPLSYTTSFPVRVNEVNAPPQVAPIPNQTIHEGELLIWTNAATDPDSPFNALTFTLDPGAPAGAAINLTNGVFSWRPAATQSPGLYPVTIRVTDDGAPPRSEAGSFTISVGARPSMVAGLSADAIVLSWDAIAGKRYRIQYKDRVDDPAWSDLGDAIVATNSFISLTDQWAPRPAQRFYRIVLE